MDIEAGRAREGIAHLDGLVQHDDGVLGEPKIVPPSAVTPENEALEQREARAMEGKLEGGEANEQQYPRKILVVHLC